MKNLAIILLLSSFPLLLTIGVIHEIILYYITSWNISTKEECSIGVIITINGIRNENTSVTTILKEQIETADRKYCVFEPTTFDDLVKSINKPSRGIILVTHFFKSEEGLPGGIGIPMKPGLAYVFFHPLTSLKTYKGYAGNKTFLVLPPSVLERLPMRKGVELLLVSCSLAGINDTISAFLKAGAEKVYWTNLQDMDSREALSIARKFLLYSYWAILCSSSSIIECRERAG